MKTGFIFLLIILCISCGVFPHYEEKLVVSDKKAYQDHTLDEICSASFEALAK